MEIPDKLKIGAVTYRVVLAKEWPTRDQDDGEIKYDRDTGHLIYIGAELTSEMQTISMIHEALHAMNGTMSHELIDSLSRQIYQFLKDNNLMR